MTTSRKVRSSLSLSHLIGPPPPDLLFPHLWNSPIATSSNYDTLKFISTLRTSVAEPFSVPLSIKTDASVDQTTSLSSLIKPTTSTFPVNKYSQDTPPHRTAYDVNYTGKLTVPLPWSSTLTSQQSGVAFSERKSLASNAFHQSKTPIHCGVKREFPHLSDSLQNRLSQEHVTKTGRQCNPSNKSTYTVNRGEETDRDLYMRNRFGRWTAGTHFSSSASEKVSKFKRLRRNSPRTNRALDGEVFHTSEEQCNEDDEDDDEEEEEDEGERSELQDETETGSKHSQNIECVVCGDKSSGKHYGQHTCEGCKSFFKRSVRRKLTYTCRGNRQCSIDVHHRNQCQYCRFQKCVKAGMRKEAVQQGRLPPFPSIYNPYFGNSPYLGPIPSILPVNGNFPGPTFYAHFISVLLRAEPLSQRHCTITMAFLRRTGFSWFGTPQTSKPSPMPSEMKGVDTTNQSTTLSESVKPVTEHSCYSKKEPNDCDNDFAIRILLTVVEWAKNISLFSDLPLQDQLLLLRNAWPELFILNMAHNGPLSPSPTIDEIKSSARASPHQCGTHANFIQSKTRDTSSSDPSPFLNGSGALKYPTISPVISEPSETCTNKQGTNNMDCFQDQLERLRMLQLDMPEFVCLKGIVLFNSEVADLSDPVTVECIQEKIQSALEEYGRHQFAHHQPFRFGRLLLRLPKLRQVTAERLQHLFFPQLGGELSMEQVIKDILLHGPPPTAVPGGIDRLSQRELDHNANLLKFYAYYAPGLPSQKGTSLRMNGHSRNFNVSDSKDELQCKNQFSAFNHLYSPPGFVNSRSPQCMDSTTHSRSPLVTPDLWTQYNPESVTSLLGNSILYPSVRSTHFEESTNQMKSKFMITQSHPSAHVKGPTFDQVKGQLISACEFPRPVIISSPKEVGSTVQTDSHTAFAGTQQTLDYGRLSKHLPFGTHTPEPVDNAKDTGKTNLVEDDIYKSSSSNSLDRPINFSDPFTTTSLSPSVCTTPSTIQLYYAVMRHQLSLLHKHTSSLISNDTVDFTRPAPRSAMWSLPSFNKTQQSLEEVKHIHQ
ncbi:hypothetical protein PHET_01934 [Paragonimus heterotremus]|uniref:Uncharacterized protein n=1 Tax=Paragonimus heterotremus TaxID=100268 RepID=A0A8J4TLD5_9TREM|nr:hypothetical protein PHET_01934 [Paragonimus heterotremus]